MEKIWRKLIAAVYSFVAYKCTSFLNRAPIRRTNWTDTTCHRVPCSKSIDRISLIHPVNIPILFFVWRNYLHYFLDKTFADVAINEERVHYVKCKDKESNQYDTFSVRWTLQIVDRKAWKDYQRSFERHKLTTSAW